jgi:hypothetical protein
MSQRRFEMFQYRQVFMRLRRAIRIATLLARSARGDTARRCRDQRRHRPSASSAQHDFHRRALSSASGALGRRRRGITAVDTSGPRD